MSGAFENLTLDFPHERVPFLECILALRDFSPSSSSIREFLNGSYSTPRLTREEMHLLRRVCERADSIFSHSSREAEKVRQTIGGLFMKDRQTTVCGFNRCDSWAEIADSEIACMEEPKRTQWIDLIDFCRTATQAKPTAKWLKEAKKRVELIGPVPFKARVSRWSREMHPSYASGTFKPEWDYFAVAALADENCQVLKGLVWCAIPFTDEEFSAVIGDLALLLFRFMGTRWGNACAAALERVGDSHCIAQISRLQYKVRDRVARKSLARALSAIADRAGMSRGELMEISTPTLGLAADGLLSKPIGEFSAELQLTDNRRVQVRWFNPDGKVQKAVPAEVKSAHAEELKDLKRLVADIETMAGAQRERVEGLFRQEREWTFDAWRERYLEHPLVASLAQRLIWNFETRGQRKSAIFHEGRLVDASGAALEGLSAETKVRLWHPLRDRPDDVLAWREWLLAHEIRQPGKQAYREVYLLTDAERRTGTYSNRFAAHILRQPQFAALCRERGWSFRIRGPFDSYENPTLKLPEHGLTVEFWIESGSNEETTDSGIYSYVSTDQVRFLRDNTPVPLADVPPLVFSEIMRDVDLFVGVASVGNDPAWADGGRRDAERNAWAHFSFGDLSATAQTRRDLLQRLVPKLKIAGRCSFEEKFLVVRGDLRTYKIHLGSGNILMSPNDQYLCIVPGSSGKAEDGKVFLPFEGDRTLSVILSKAFLLAADTKITDPSITRQIGIAPR